MLVRVQGKETGQEDKDQCVARVLASALVGLEGDGGEYQCPDGEDIEGEGKDKLKPRGAG